VAICLIMWKVTFQTPLITCPWERGAQCTGCIHTPSHLCVSSDVVAFHTSEIIMSSFCLIQDISKLKVPYLECKFSVFTVLGGAGKVTISSYGASESFGLCEHQMLLWLSSVHICIPVIEMNLCR